MFIICADSHCRIEISFASMINIMLCKINVVTNFNQILKVWILELVQEFSELAILRTDCTVSLANSVYLEERE